MQSHAGQKPFSNFRRKKRKMQKNLLVTSHTTVTSRYQRWGKSYRESLTLLPSEKAPPWRISSTQCKRLAFKIAEARVMAFVSWHWIRMFVHFSTINVIVRSIFFHHDFHVLLILLLSILVHCLCMKTHKRWRHWHSLPRADQLWSPNGEKNISSGVVFTIYSIFSSSLFMSTFVIFPPIFFSGWRRVQPEALRSGSSARKPS